MSQISTAGLINITDVCREDKFAVLVFEPRVFQKGNRFEISATASLGGK
jgi:hypothetical protein